MISMKYQGLSHETEKNLQDEIQNLPDCTLGILRRQWYILVLLDGVKHLVVKH